MIVGKITGTVVSTKKDELLEGFKFYVVDEVDLNMNPTGKYLIAVDIVGAGIDEIVLVVQGSSARQSTYTESKPVDAVVIAIIDSIEVKGETKYLK
jgi:microcompartment protein CcmK/EutM